METANFLGIAVNVLAVSIIILFWCIVVVRIVKSRFGKEKTVSAKVADKYVTKTAPGIYGVFNRERYLVVFSVDGTKLSFPVSQYSFSQYRIGEKGQLRYKGKKLLSFD